MTEIVIEREGKFDEITVDQNHRKEVMIWQSDWNILISPSQLPQLITALQQMQENPKTK